MGLLDGKIALITGTAGGQGRVACRTFTREGAKVIGCDLRAEDNAATVQHVRDAGGTMTGIAPVDLTDPLQAQRFVETAAKTYGGLDIVYNNAGGARFSPVPDLSIEDWRTTLAVELDTAFFVSKFAWPHLVDRGGGVILNISSMAGLIGFPSPPMAAHVAAKAGLTGLTRQLAVEGGPVGVRAVTISPGAIVTREEDLDEATRETIKARSLLKRWGRPEEIVEAAVFLASDRASYITGANLAIDGGVTAW
jgi:NAD(P)-dependent dehydrogenase (short-subunit alcohol dehydrogenase family)